MPSWALQWLFNLNKDNWKDKRISIGCEAGSTGAAGGRAARVLAVCGGAASCAETETTGAMGCPRKRERHGRRRSVKIFPVEHDFFMSYDVKR